MENFTLTARHGDPMPNFIGPGYQVLIGSINLFIGRPSETEQESTQEVPLEEVSQPDASFHHFFVGFAGELSDPERSVETSNHDDKQNFSDADLYQEEDKYTDTRSIRSVKEDRLGSDPEEYDLYLPYYEFS